MCGPKDDGTIPDESIARLKQVGAWMKVNGEAVYGTKASPLAAVSWGRSNQERTEWKYHFVSERVQLAGR